MIPSQSLPKNDEKSPLYLSSVADENGSIKLTFGDGFSIVAKLRDIWPSGVPKGINLKFAIPSQDGRRLKVPINGKEFTIETVILRTLTDNEFAENLRERLRHDTSQALKIIRDRAINKSQLEVALCAIIDYLQEAKVHDLQVHNLAIKGLNAAHDLTNCLQKIRQIKNEVSNN